jgi:hypothetical protein
MRRETGASLASIFYSGIFRSGDANKYTVNVVGITCYDASYDASYLSFRCIRALIDRVAFATIYQRTAFPSHNRNLARELRLYRTR